jgi:hypothetical protein
MPAPLPATRAQDRGSRPRAAHGMRRATLSEAPSSSGARAYCSSCAPSPSPAPPPLHLRPRAFSRPAPAPAPPTPSLPPSPESSARGPRPGRRAMPAALPSTHPIPPPPPAGPPLGCVRHPCRPGTSTRAPPDAPCATQAPPFGRAPPGRQQQPHSPRRPSSPLSVPHSCCPTRPHAAAPGSPRPPIWAPQTTGPSRRAPARCMRGGVRSPPVTVTRFAGAPSYGCPSCPPPPIPYLPEPPSPAGPAPAGQPACERGGPPLPGPAPAAAHSTRARPPAAPPAANGRTAPGAQPIMIAAGPARAAPRTPGRIYHSQHRPGPSAAGGAPPGAPNAPTYNRAAGACGALFASTKHLHHMRPCPPLRVPRGCGPPFCASPPAPAVRVSLRARAGPPNVSACAVSLPPAQIVLRPP